MPGHGIDLENMELMLSCSSRFGRLKTIRVLLWMLVLVLLPDLAWLHAQVLKVDPNAAAAPQSLEDRRKALNRSLPTTGKTICAIRRSLLLRLGITAITTRLRTIR
jgi:hypothetical protein